MRPATVYSKLSSRCDEERVQSPQKERVKYSSAGVGTGVCSAVGGGVVSGAGEGVAYSGAGRGTDGASPQPDSIKAAAIEQPNAIMRRNLQQFIRGLYRKGPPNARKSAGFPALVRFI